MWTRLATMDRVGWTHELNNCDAWNTLSADLLLVVAKHCDASSVCRLSQACKDWRNAVAANSSQIWKQLLHVRFPRTVPLLAALPPRPGFSYVVHYREQLKAETKKPRRKCQSTTCELSDFVFNVELVTAGRRRIVDSWTGTLDSLAFEHDHFVCPIDAGPWYNSWGMPRGGGPGPMRLEVFVSRALHGQIKTRKLYVSCNEPNEPIGDGIDAFESVSLPMTRPRAVRDDRGSHFQDDHEVETHLRLVLDRTRSPYSAIDLEFLLYCPASGEDEYMSKEQVLSYLEHDISWYSRKEEKRLHWK
jgi:hypothetical protein